MSANNPFGAEMGAGTSSTVYGVVISSVISSRGSLDFENVVGAEDELELDDEELNDDELNEELDDICRLLAIVMDQNDQEPDLQGELQSAQTPSHWGSHLLPHG